MKPACFNYFLLLVFFTLNISAVLKAQFLFQANAETGVYNSKGNFLLKKSGLFTGLEGKAAYKYQHEKTTAGMQLKFRPEFYGSGSNLTSLKFRVSTDLTRREDKFNWGLSLTKDINNISNDIINIDYDIFSAAGSLVFFMIKNLPISVNCGYSYQKTTSISNQKMNLIYGELKFHQSFNSYFKVVYGLYSERFSIKNNSIPRSENTINSNSGLRTGPSIEANYLKKFVLNFQYRFLFHSSQQTEFPSYEQWIRLVAGKVVVENVSVFMLVDYYFRKYKSPSSINALPVLYVPLNQENHISFRVGHDISKNVELYIKAGYFKENLIYDNISIESWNSVLGIQMNN